MQISFFSAGFNSQNNKQDETCRFTRTYAAFKANKITAKLGSICVGAQLPDEKDWKMF